MLTSNDGVYTSYCTILVNIFGRALFSKTKVMEGSHSNPNSAMDLKPSLSMSVCNINTNV